MNAHALALLPLLAATLASADRTVRLDELDLSSMSCGGGLTACKGSSVGGGKLRVFRKNLAFGVGVQAPSVILLETKNVKSFDARVGVDAETLNKGNGSVRFRIFSEKEVLADSGVMTKRMKAKELHVNLVGIPRIGLEVTDGGDGEAFDHADWGEAVFTLADDGSLAPTDKFETEQLGILTPAPAPAPRLNAPALLGVRPGHLLRVRIPVVGARPIQLNWSLQNGPQGTSQIFEWVADAHPGERTLHLTASNAYGTAEKKITIRIGEKLALTPPMGWNDWNRFARDVSDADIRAAADALISSGLADHGFEYVNIDDFWQRTPDMELAEDLQGPARDDQGVILPNRRFPDMKALTAYIHARGLKAGLYSSPGPTTCGGCYGSWGHEQQDAKTYADWGFDYLKYDWCSYSGVATPEANPLKQAMKPFLVMGEALRAQNRDIVFSICQYGMDHVSAWGAAAGGSCWRTTDDVFDNYPSIRAAADKQDGLGIFTAPGAWNDADMLVVGLLGWGREPRPSRLTHNEQYTQLTLWCLFGSPLMLGCDLTQIDDFTRNLLTNDEVLDISRNSLGAGATRKILREEFEVWTRPLADGSTAVAIVSRDYLPGNISFSWSEIGLADVTFIRDLWRQTDLESTGGNFSCRLPGHAPLLLKVRGKAR